MTYDFGEFNNWGALKSVAIRAPEAAFVSQARVDAEWQGLNFHSRPDFAEARREYEAVLKALRGAGADVIALPAGDGLTLDSLYTHDALIVTPEGPGAAAYGQARTPRRAPGQCRASAKAWAFRSRVRSPRRARSRAAISSGSTARP